MKKKLITLCAILCSAVATSFADTFSVSDFVATENSTVDITIYTNLDAAIKNKALSIDVIIPEGYSIATVYDEDLEEDVADVNILITSMMPGFSIKQDGSLRIGCAGCTVGKGIKPFASFRLNVSADAKNSLFTTGATKIAGSTVDNITFVGNVLRDITLNANGYATYSVCAPVSVDGATVMGAILSGNTLTLAGEGTDVPANTGVVLKGAPGATVSFVAAEDEVEEIASDLTPAVLPTTVAANSVLTLSTTEKAFYTYTGTEIPANKAYLENSASTGRIRIIEDDATGIQNINAESLNLNYNLMGQQVKTQKGILIENGQKVVKF